MLDEVAYTEFILECDYGCTQKLKPYLQSMCFWRKVKEFNPHRTKPSNMIRLTLENALTYCELMDIMQYRLCENCKVYRWTQ